MSGDDLRWRRAGDLRWEQGLLLGLPGQPGAAGGGGASGGDDLRMA